MKELSVLEMLNAHPMAGALLLGMMLMVQKLIVAWKGNSSVSRIEKENNKLARQTSETVNRCSERTGEVMAATKDVIVAIEKFLATDKLGYISQRLDATLSLLEEMAHHKDAHHAALVRVADLCNDIATDLKRTDSRLVHSNILNKVEALEKIAETINRRLG